MRANMSQSGQLLRCMFAGLFCLLALGESAAQGEDTVTVRLRWRHQFQFAGYYAALEKGFYREAGLDVRLEEAVAGEDSADAVLSGKANFGVGGAELVVQRAAGKPVVVLAAVFQHSPLVILAGTKSGISSVHDLVGRRVALEQQSIELNAYFQHEGIRTDQITVLPHPFDPSPLARGEVDAISAYSTDEPWLLEQMGFDFLLFSPRAGGIDFYGDCLFTEQSQIDRNPERVRSFLNASLRGWKYALDHQEEIVGLILSKYSNRHTIDHLRFEARETARLVLPEIVELGYINPGRWRYIADTCAELGIIPQNYSLAGFIYERNPRPDLRNYYAVIGGLSALLAVVAALGFWYYRINGKLRREMAERSRAEAALLAAEQRFRILVERAPFPIAISVPDTGRVRFCNEQWEKELMPPEGSPDACSTVDLYEDPQARAELLRLLEENDAVRDHEALLKKPDGSTIWAYLSAALIDFGGEQALLVAFNDITPRKAAEQENVRLINDLQQALQDVKTLRGLIPICSYCKRIRNDAGFWLQVDAYIQQHTAAEFSHGVCPECKERVYQDLRGDMPPQNP